MKAWWGRCDRWAMNVILVANTRKKAAELAGVTIGDFPFKFESTVRPKYILKQGVYRQFENVWVPIEVGPS